MIYCYPRFPCTPITPTRLSSLTYIPHSLSHEYHSQSVTPGCVLAHRYPVVDFFLSLFGYLSSI